MMPVYFHPEAQADLDHAVAYYESCESGLGLAFSEAIKTSLQHIRSFPSAWPPVTNSIRRCQIRRFPYALLYTVQTETIYILAVMHMHRSPEYWTDRE